MAVKNPKALADLMGPYKFGMTKQDVLKVLSREIGARYKERIANTVDVYQQDKLRRERQAELDRIKNSYIEFKTRKRTGWDVSIIDDQFAHETDESMMVHWENSADSGKDQRRFFFFHDGRLYKMVIALNSSMLKPEQKNFDFFKNLMVARYGAGRLVNDPNGRYLEWKTHTYRVAAIDKLNFYGSFCLLIADPREEAALAPIRAAAKPPKKDNKVIDAVIKDKDEKDPGLEDNKAAVDAVLK